MARVEIDDERLVEIYSAGVRESVLEVIGDRPPEAIEQLMAIVEKNIGYPDANGLRAVWDAAVTETEEVA